VEEASHGTTHHRDLGKTVFHLVGLNLHGEVVVRKKFSQLALPHPLLILARKLVRLPFLAKPCA
jgi:hypothetical protein